MNVPSFPSVLGRLYSFKDIIQMWQSGKPGLVLTFKCKDTEVRELHTVCVRTQSVTHNATPMAVVPWCPEGHFLISIRHVSRVYLSLGEGRHLKDSVCSNALQLFIIFLRRGA